MTYTYFTGFALPWQIKLVGAFFGLFGLIAFTLANYILGSILIILFLLIFTGHYGLTIDTGSKRYKEYISFLGLKNGKWKDYAELEYIFINTAQVSQKMYTPRTLNSSTFNFVEYNSWLKFGDETKVHLYKGKKKEKLMKKTERIASDIGVEVRDLSESH